MVLYVSTVSCLYITKYLPLLHLTELTLQVMDVGSQGRTSTLEGGSHACESHVNPEHVHVCLFVRPAYMQCCYKGQGLGVGGRSGCPTRDRMAHTLTPHTQIPIHRRRNEWTEGLPLICLRILVRSVIHLRTLGLAALSPWEGWREKPQSKSWYFRKKKIYSSNKVTQLMSELGKIKS